jgi:hypothetical protein
MKPSRNVKPSRNSRPILLGVLALTLSAGVCGAAEPEPSRHQLMKECMAKQKSADSGLPKEDMKNTCKDVTKTEKQNDDAAKKLAEKPAPPAR